jgi:hypothetical protein
MTIIIFDSIKFAIKKLDLQCISIYSVIDRKSTSLTLIYFY